MPTDDLSSIPGLEGKHVRALAKQEVTELRSFADADQRDLYRAMANIRPRPSLELISQWQAEASSRLRAPERDAMEDAIMDDATDDEPKTGTTDWRTVASFAVIFAQRQVGSAWDRRVEAERTEVEPEQEPQTWAGWDFAPVGAWMASQLQRSAGVTAPGQPGETAPPDTAPPETAPVETAPVESGPQDTGPLAEAELAEATDGPAAARTQLGIETASVIAANQTLALIAESAVVGALPAELTAPVRVVFTVGGAPPGTAVRAVTRVLRPDEPGWNPLPPVTLQRSGQAEFDLAGIPAGHYELSLIAWAPDATAKPVSVRLPALTIR